MVPVAEMLSTQRALLGRIVQDRTGLAGPYNIELEFESQILARRGTSWIGDPNMSALVSGSGTVWVIPAAGGQPQKVGSNFTSARYPI